MKDRYLITGFFACHIILVATVIYLVVTMPKIYSIGVNRVIQSFSNQLESANIDAKARDAVVLQFTKTLEAELKTIVKPRDILVMEEAVITGAIDITEKFAKHLQVKLNESKK